MLAQVNNEGISVNNTPEARNASDEIIKSHCLKWSERNRLYQNVPLNAYLKSIGDGDNILFQIWKNYCLENIYKKVTTPSTPPMERKTSNYLFSYAIPSNVVLNVIAVLVKKHCSVDGKARLLDMGCGSGYWSKLLSEKGLEITAVDDEREGITTNSFFAHKSIRMDAVTYMKTYPKWYTSTALFLCWPRPSEDMKSVLINYKGPLLIFIGLIDESTLNVPHLVKSHSDLKSRWQPVDTSKIQFPSWPGVGDKMYIFKSVQ